ncbi:DsbA family protein [Herbiconiux sp. SYSU D00978]|uniref:DsbA family protein n=1 Tax=Herbiconiux sp. SYSU D00978 TaxID=2812562 RepID=UPI001A96F26B|nr:thioredoxin domain-containing protein [Herbiconiux sp. SYSU D00978]
MTNSDDNLTKNQRREAAREKAKQLREQQRKKEKRGRLILQGSLILVAVAIIAGVSLIIVNAIRPAGPGPANMASDGILIQGENLEAVQTPGLEPGEEPAPTQASADANTIDIRVYLDYLCPFCAQFEEANNQQLETFLRSGAATLEIHPIAILNNNSMGSQYSTRAANAAACVANYSPNSFFDFNQLMFENQPEEGTTGLTDEQLVGITQEAGVESASDIEECITDQTYRSWVLAATQRALDDIPDSDVEDGLTGTPTVIVNGSKYNGAPDDAEAFAQFVLAANGQAFTESESSPSPSPSPEG